MAQVILSKGFSCLVDDEDLPLVSGLNWYTHNSRGKLYAACYINHKRTLMHRYLLGALTGSEVDHIDGDGLNNRRLNLRQCTHSQNAKNRSAPKSNTSGRKGVYWLKKLSKWRAQICVDGHKVMLGCFESIEDAARAYEDAAQKYFGEFNHGKGPTQ